MHQDHTTETSRHTRADILFASNFGPSSFSLDRVLEKTRRCSSLLEVGADCPHVYEKLVRRLEADGTYTGVCFSRQALADKKEEFRNWGRASTDQAVFLERDLSTVLWGKCFDLICLNSLQHYLVWRTTAEIVALLAKLLKHSKVLIVRILIPGSELSPDRLETEASEFDFRFLQDISFPSIEFFKEFAKTSRKNLSVHDGGSIERSGVTMQTKYLVFR